MSQGQSILQRGNKGNPHAKQKPIIPLSQTILKRDESDLSRCVRERYIGGRREEEETTFDQTLKLSCVSLNVDAYAEGSVRVTDLSVWFMLCVTVFIYVCRCHTNLHTHTVKVQMINDGSSLVFSLSTRMHLLRTQNWEPEKSKSSNQ